jgi:hypothetical protein
MRIAISFLYAAMVAACAVHQPPADHASLFQAETDRVRVEFGFPGITAACVFKDGTVVTAASRCLSRILSHFFVNCSINSGPFQRPG